MSQKFDDKNYESKDGLSPKIWGCPLWFVLHAISFTYPVEPSPVDKEHYATFLLSLAHVLPCRTCRENFKQSIKALRPEHLATRASFARFVYQLHNAVPNCPALKVSFEDMRHNYENFRSECGKHGCKTPKEPRNLKTMVTVVPEERYASRDTFHISKSCFRRRDHKDAKDAKNAKDSKSSKRSKR
jgi:hypothetical protein